VIRKANLGMLKMKLDKVEDTLRIELPLSVMDDMPRENGHYPAELLSYKQAAEMMGISVPMIKKMATIENALEYIKIGSRTLIPKVAVLDYIRKKRKQMARALAIRV